VTPWARRAARARSLADRHEAAADLLSFCARLAEYQDRLAAGAGATRVDQAASVQAALPAFLEWLEREAPAALRATVPALRDVPAEEWRRRIEQVAGAGEADGRTAFVIEALVQPLAATRESASAGRDPSDSKREQRCPSCGGLPVVGLLREEGHGARRSLVCGRCLSEWEFRRVCCPACRETTFQTLPVFAAEQFPHVRVEACDACRRYLKTLDLTKDGLADPVADDLASVVMDLWAAEQGYRRLRPSLLRT
jgi:FdhE protein